MSVPSYMRKKGKLDCIIKAESLLKYTLLITKNKKIFAEEYYEPITKDIIETSKSIFIEAFEANNIYVNDAFSWSERKKKQSDSVSKCKRLLALMQLSGTVFHLESKRIENWGSHRAYGSILKTTYGGVEMKINRLVGTIAERTAIENAQSESEKANVMIEYVAMMSGVDIPEESMEVNTNEE